jgi:hypothetical protein
MDFTMTDLAEAPNTTEQDTAAPAAVLPLADARAPRVTRSPLILAPFRTCLVWVGAPLAATVLATLLRDDHMDKPIAVSLLILASTASALLYVVALWATHQHYTDDQRNYAQLLWRARGWTSTKGALGRCRHEQYDIHWRYTGWVLPNWSLSRKLWPRWEITFYAAGRQRTIVLTPASARQHGHTGVDRTRINQALEPYLLWMMLAITYREALVAPSALPHKRPLPLPSTVTN